MTKQFVLNKETQKIELSFEKSDYLSLTEAQKSKLKSNFLWSNSNKSWVSRSKNNHYSAIATAKELDFADGGSINERLSYEEELQRNSEKAEARAERYEEYSDNAETRAERLQAEFNECRKDWSWLTQPIIAGHSGSRAFNNHKNKVMARYEKGFAEYHKSEYYQDRAATVRSTADNVKLEDKIYLSKKIKECNKTLKMYQEHVIKYEEALYKIQQGEELKNRSGEILTEDYIEERITDQLEKYEWENDRLEFFEKCLDNLGGVQFSKENIKIGYIVNIKRWGKCEIVGAGPLNVTYKILTGGATGMGGTTPYAAITEIIEEKEKNKSIDNPFQVGNILCKYYGMSSNNGVYGAYQVVKVTATGVKLQEILIENKLPIKNKFKYTNPIQKKVTKSKFSETISIWLDNWQLYKYDQTEITKAM